MRSDVLFSVHHRPTATTADDTVSPRRAAGSDAGSSAPPRCLAGSCPASEWRGRVVIPPDAGQKMRKQQKGGILTTRPWRARFTCTGTGARGRVVELGNLMCPGGPG
eukprot:gene620-biopygen7636